MIRIHINLIIAFLACLPLFKASQTSTCSSQTDLGALYTMTNDLDGNSVIALTIGPDGKLTAKSATSTGGTGATPGIPGGDPSSSQDIMTVSGSRLYVANLGSNTLSALEIDTDDPTKLSLIGKPISTKGDFPVSVAVSPRTGQVCVLNGGTVDPKSINGVNCYKQDKREGLIEIPNTFRPLGQNITFSPIGLLAAPSQVVWSPDGKVLYAVVKGIPGTQNGFIASWTVDTKTGALSQNFTKSETPALGGLPFSMTPVEGTEGGYLVADILQGYDIFSFPDPAGEGLSASHSIPGEQAACWSRGSKKTGNIYVGDLSGVVTEVHVDTRLQPQIITQYDLSMGAEVGLNEELIGHFPKKDYLYVLLGLANKIVTLDLEAPGQANVIQEFNLTTVNQLGVTINGNLTAGLAIFQS